MNKKERISLNLIKGIAGRPRLVSFLTFIIAGCMSALFIYQVDRSYVLSAKAEAGEFMNDIRTEIQQNLEYDISLCYALGVLVCHGHGEADDLKNSADELLLTYPRVTSIQLLSEGEVQQETSFMKGNEKEMGEILFSGPYRVGGGGYEATARLPVQLDREEGDFQGFICITLDITKLIDDAILPHMREKGFSYELWYTPVTKEREVMARSELPLKGPAINETIKVRGTDWTLSISPVGGWHDIRVGAAILMALLFSLLMAQWGKMMVKLNLSKQQLEEIAFLDGLTGLPNRRLFEDRLRQAVAHSNRTGEMVAVCYLDLDDFKLINDTFGHKAGDYLLVEMSQELKLCLRETDTLARLGGDEFVIILLGLESKAECEIILQRIMEKCSSTFNINIGETSTNVSLSIGAAFYPTDTRDIHELVQFADKAMYDSKEEGKGRYYFYN